MRKIRRKRPLWFPIIPAAGPDQSGDNFNARVFALSVAPNGVTTPLIFPVIPDKQVDADDLGAGTPGQLIQHLGNSYELERIVGKIFLGVGASEDAGVGEIKPKIIQVGCGFFVARQADEDAGGGADLPIGAPTAAEQVENYSPLSEDTMREPWIWHRTWLMHTGRVPGNIAQALPFMGAIAPAVAGGSRLPGLPSTNVNYGAEVDGPHIDARSGRRVGGDERLYFAVAARALDVILNIGPTPDQVALDAVKGVLQIRVLGWPRTARKRSAF